MFLYRKIREIGVGEITDPLYLPLKRGGLVCLPLESPYDIQLSGWKIYLCAKNIRFRAIRVQKKICVHLCNLWENKIIIRVQKKQSAQVPHTNAEPWRTTFILSVMLGDYHSRLPTRPLPLPHHIISQPSCHSQYTFHEASR